jgi:neutral trehalase
MYTVMWNKTTSQWHDCTLDGQQIVTRGTFVSNFIPLWADGLQQHPKVNICYFD